MSSIPTKQIDGDVAVGRNVAMGGNAKVNGSVTVGHNLMVKGWLEARNIKGPQKGLFKDAEQLSEAYPEPQAGWWALVGAALPAQLYLAEKKGDVVVWAAQKDSSGNAVMAGNPTIDSAEYNEMVESLAGDIDAVKVEVAKNAGDISSLNDDISGLGGEISGLRNNIASNSIAITNARNAADNAQGAADAINGKIGAAGGIAPLGADKKIPTKYLPSYVDDVAEFDGFLRMEPLGGLSVSDTSLGAGYNILFVPSTGCFVANAGDIYANNWPGADSFGQLESGSGRKPESGKVYVDKSTNKTYRWSGSQMTVIGSDLALGYTSGTAFPGDEGLQLQKQAAAIGEALRTKVDWVDFEAQVEECAGVAARVNGVAIVPLSGICETAKAPKSGVYFDTTKRELVEVTRPNGYASYDYMDGGLPRMNIIYRYGSRLYRYDAEKEAMVEIGGSADGNCLNLTAELPKTGTTNPYYTLKEAISAIVKAGRMKLGMQITFAATATTWKQYQYIGTDLDPEGDFGNTLKWNDLAGMSAGKEEIINVNDLCGNGSLKGGAYTLATALDAIDRLEASSGITYRKAGMIITYKAEGDGKWETKQLKQPEGSFGNTAAWDDFGGGNQVQVKTSDKPEPKGTDAFSTGGAFNTIPTGFEKTEEDGTVSITLLNADKKPIMEPIEFSVGTGSGEVGGSIVTIAFKNPALSGALGSALTTKAAIRSVTKVGSVESENTIVKLEVIDRDSNQSLWSSSINKGSSATLQDYSFDLDFTPYFTVAGEKHFMLIATDDTGKTGCKFITVTAEDLTLSCKQRLSETIAPTDTAKYIDMYAFENNQTEGGINVYVDMLIDGEWKNIHTALETRSFTRGVTINATALGLTHGTYALRMYGVSTKSGVRGNTVYSSLMCVDPAEKNTTLIALRYDDTRNGKIKLFETVNLDVAAYRTNGGEQAEAIVDVMANEHKIAQVVVSPDGVVNVKKQISGYKQGDTLSFRGVFGASQSPAIEVEIDGSVLDISLKEGASLDLDFSSRSNDEADHTIEANGYKMSVFGANWTTNGFVDFLGSKALRIAENVKAVLPYAPFGDSTVEQTGAAFQMKIATRNILDPDAHLIECYNPDNGLGFYICGNKGRLYSKTAISGLEAAPNYKDFYFESNKEVTIAFVVEPSSVYKERDGVRYSMLKIYVDGEEQGSIGYVAGRGTIFSEKTLTFDGVSGDLYLYYLLGYRSYYEWSQAFDNYLVKGTDTEAMVEEYNRENVLASQTAEGTTAMRPQFAALWNQKVRHMIVVDTPEGFKTFDFGNGSEDNGFTTSPKFKNITQIFRDPVKPWRSNKSKGVTKKRQGTTSTLRTLKNEDDDYSKATITPLYPEYVAQEVLDALWPGQYRSDPEVRATMTQAERDDADTTAKLFAMRYIRIGDNSMPIQKAMNKVDFSDSSCANNGGVCDMMNATYRAMGSDYLTPAQRFYDGTWDKGDVHLSGIQLNHSIANFPCAIFRSNSEDLSNVYFHARGSYMESKKEQAALGFRDVKGYNKGCLNYGDFKELFCAPGQTLAQYVAAADKSTWEYTTDAENADAPNYDVIVISEYCGRNFKVFRRADNNSPWQETTGSMRQVNGKWTVTGDVLNPVTGFELLNYTGICWWMGVATVEDMMAPTTSQSSWVQKLKLGQDTYPYWTQFFECMIEDDQLAIDYAMGRKVPYELFNTLRFMNSVDYSKVAGWKEIWKQNAWKFMSIHSTMVYHIFTDYLAAVDQRAKNMQPMWFLEDGCSIINGEYINQYDMEPCRMYLNKVYDCDTCNGKDNDGGQTIDAEVDPDKPTDESTGYTNPYAGWGSILFNNIAKCKEDEVVCGRPEGVGSNKTSPTLKLTAVAQSMRSNQVTLPDGRAMVPFSPEGARYYFIEQRIAKWAKKVCTYDCERKYIDRTDKANQIYFYANNGSGRTSLNRFIEARWLVRDGFYQTGGFFTNPLVMRINCRESAKIRITAAARGYFAVGYENVGQLTESVFLEAGESHEFTDFSKTDGTKLYIYQVGRMSRLDLSDLSISGADFKDCAMLRELIIGSETHENLALGSYGQQSTLPLGNLPFLESVDVRNTMVQSIDASGCPRIAHIYAQGSKLETLTLAATSPINDITLPDTMTDIIFQDLPALTYTGIEGLDGLRIAAYAMVKRLRVESSPKVNAALLLKKIVNAANSALARVRIVDQTLQGDGKELQKLLAMGVQGINSNGNDDRPRPVVVGEYKLTQLLESAEVAAIEAGIEGVTIAIVVEAFVDAMDKVNAESYGGAEEVETVTMENVDGHLLYYNGETYEEYFRRINQENQSTHSVIVA